MSHYGYVELSPLTHLRLFWLPCSLRDVETAVNYVTITKMADGHSGRVMFNSCILFHLCAYVCTQLKFLYLKQDPEIIYNNLCISLHSYHLA
jgi:hypothetical protein